MAKFAGEVLGRLLTLLGWDGAEFRNVKVDAAGHVQVDVLSTAKAIGVATEGKQNDGNATLVNLTRLLNALGSVNTDDFQVDVKSSALPAGAATQATLTLIKATTDFLALTLEMGVGGVPAVVHTLDHSVLLPTGAAIATKQLFPSGGVAEEKKDLNADAGNNGLIGTAVGAGEMWCVTCLGINDVQTAPSLAQGTVVVSGYSIPLINTTTLGANAWEIWSGQVWMVEGDYVSAWFEGCTAGDDLYLRYSGYKIVV